ARRDVHVAADRKATDDSVKLTAHGYFRGQWLTSESDVKLNRTPELVVSRAPPPPDAAVAVRAANDLDLGAIAIVLDFSGSMAELPSPSGQRRRDWKSPESKNQQAVKVLREVLVGLPAGTPISLRLFGHTYDEPLYKQKYAELSDAKKRDAETQEVLTTEVTQSELIYK